MTRRSIASISSLLNTILFFLATSTLISAHTVITYPGWRGDNLQTNGTIQETRGLGEGDNQTFPYGMQWMYPCGGMPISQNRTKWPVKGGAIAIQPGWFAGHATAMFYINLGYGTLPPNMSNPMVSVFQIIGPTKEPYPGTFCLPQVPLPTNASVQIGDNATIQVVETAVHGAALYNCVDITFADPDDVAEVNSTNCFNSTDIGFELIYATERITSAAPPGLNSPPGGWMMMVPVFVMGLMMMTMGS
ncbi:MAG: hypothetical protein M1834_009089 [Cirrosporium novae-zelandiae]|nr:MAG: hypothetical protein M1834_009089 [Cirrosporium novae-zelandiae]